MTCAEFQELVRLDKDLAAQTFYEMNDHYQKCAFCYQWTRRKREEKRVEPINLDRGGCKGGQTP
jgi:hypothetical protein